MTTPTIEELVERSLQSLKDFQQATVEVVYNNLFHDGQQRMLVADEVGLGKTIVAKGVIAKRIRSKLEINDKSPLKVTYICSNQVIAHENVGKLDIYPNQQSHDRFASRLTYLAFQPDGDDDGLLRLNTLTPGTSFNKGSSTGQKGERKILFSLLMQDDDLNGHGKAISAILRAGVRKSARDWYDQLKAEGDKPCGVSLRPCCSDRFLEAIRKRKISYSDCELFDHLETRRSVVLHDAVLGLANLVTLKNLNQYREASDHLVRELKDVLSEVCVEYIDADIYILDEFQRFKELVNRESESETAEIARRIFGKENARILLLSATPFKAFTGDSALESGEEHYKEFRTILSFLFNDDSSCLDEYETQRQALFKQLLELGATGKEINTEHRDAVQAILRRIMCRTERLSVANDFNAMTIDKWQSQPLQLTSGDIKNFVATDNVVRVLNETEPSTKAKLHAPVEFCKSALFPLSFLDGYKIKKQLQSRKKEGAIRNELRANKSAWINHRKVNEFKLDLNDADAAATNAKLNQVLDEVLDKNGENLLWVPPSLPCYRLAGAFENSNGFSKTLVFSAWLMVPRMLSSLISYEVERRTIGNKKTMDSQEQKSRKYFRSRPRPVRQLVFSQKKTEEGESPNNMSNFALLFPSQTLAGLFDPNDCLLQSRSLAEIRSEICDKLKTLIDEADLEQFVQPSGESERWYWAAPLLLDRNNPSLKDSLDGWLEGVQNSVDSTFLNAKKESKGRDEGSSKEKHFEEFKRCFDNPKNAGLGRIPFDLPQVLADIAIAGPATTTLRSVKANFKDDDFYNQTLFAFDIAGEFTSLFNKPEAIATVRLSTEPETYWRRALKYCLDGCLQSVLDEFFHILVADCPEIWDLFKRLVSSMNLGTASINVDDLSGFLKGKKKKMRCHYAVDLGNQRMETEGGKKRIKGIRHNFNSPFRPFVLTTTSIGQEGLDFHTYCRKIVHWNLPSNPIDLEQREGRINRFKGLVIRQQIASKYGRQLTSAHLENFGLWDALFNIADQAERVGTGKCELIPYWHVEADRFQIERIIPFYPFSRDRAKLTSLLKTLAIYRLAFGQPRQSELVEHLLTNISNDRLEEIRDKLIIDLSPICYREMKKDAV